MLVNGTTADITAAGKCHLPHAYIFLKEHRSDNSSDLLDIFIFYYKFTDIGCVESHLWRSVRFTITPMFSIALKSTFVSLTSGIFFYINSLIRHYGSSKNRKCAAFLAPPISTSPTNGLPPLIAYCSIVSYLCYSQIRKTFLCTYTTFWGICKYNTLIQVLERVHLATINQNLKVKMRSRTDTGITAQCNTFSLFYRLADLDQYLA